jgi:hypothetical protein
MHVNSSSKRKWIILVLIVSAVVILYPLKKAVVPAQHVLVTTKDMHPISNALVRQIWQDYSLERYGHEEDLRTDTHGRVTFPTRSIRAPLVWRLLGPLASIAGQGVHASAGVHTDMFPLANKDAQVSTEVVQREPNEIWYWLER